jgi:hypothetical protein
MIGAEFMFPARFYSVDVGNASLTQLGTTNAFLSSMDFSPSGVLYSASGSITEVDPATGLTTNQRPLTFTGGPISSDIISGLAFSPTGVAYGSGNGNGNLWKIDVDTAVAEFVGSSGASFFSLEFGPGGVLYGADFNLYEVDPLTGNAINIGPIVTDSVSLFTGLDFADDGVLYGVTSDITSDSLYAIDWVSGQGTQIGSTGGNLASIASVPGTIRVVPEPLAVSLWSMSLLMVLPFIRVRRNNRHASA